MEMKLVKNVVFFGLLCVGLLLLSSGCKNVNNEDQANYRYDDEGAEYNDLEYLMEDADVEDEYMDEEAIYVDLGQPSGTLWRIENERNPEDAHVLYSYDAAVEQFGSSLPTKAQFEELRKLCKWTWCDDSYRVTGPSGEFIVLEAMGLRGCGDGTLFAKGKAGRYWTSDPDGANEAWSLYFIQDEVRIDNFGRRQRGQSVCLVQEKDDNQGKQVKQEEKNYAPKYVDLGLPSGTLWKEKNEEGLYTYEQAVSKFGNSLPTKEQLEELTRCTTMPDYDGYVFKGKNGNLLYLPSAGRRNVNGNVSYGNGYYWSSSPYDSELAWFLCVGSRVQYDQRNFGQSVRLVKNK